ncbi:MAG TPA: carboxylesterase family protein, partial [Mucilaginibacter sp.]
MIKKQTKIAFGILILSAPFIFYSFIVSKAYFLPVVRIESGMISGVKNKTGDVTAYKGIPFAAPPVGELRWKAP